MMSALFVPMAQAAKPPETKLTVGILLISPAEIPWSAAHLLGYKNVVEAIPEVDFNTLTWTATTDFSATAATSAAESMILKGAKVVFVTAEDWCQAVNDDLAPRYPQVNFACIRGPVAKNLISMYPKSWEGFAAACAAATATVDEPNLGLLGAYANNPQVASNHGACAKAFEDAWAESHKSLPKVAMAYVNSWSSPDEASAAEALAAEGSRVVAVHQDSTRAAEALSNKTPMVWVIGYDSDWAKFTKPNQHVLTSVVINWTDVYSRAIRGTLDGTFEGFKWNPGMETNAVTLAPFSPKAPPVAKAMAEKYIQKLVSGWRPCGDDEKMWAMDDWHQCMN